MTHPHPTPPERFAALLQMLQQAVAACFRDGLIAVPLIVRICQRVDTIRQRFARLAARIEAGTYKPRRPFHRRPSAARKPPTPDPLPQKPGWLVPLMPYRPERRVWGAWCAGSLHHLLHNDPEMQTLMAAAPEEMRRILAPLCRMLGVKRPAILAPAKRAAPAPATPEPATAPKSPPRPEARCRPRPAAPAPPARVPAHAAGPPKTA